MWSFKIDDKARKEGVAAKLGGLILKQDNSNHPYDHCKDFTKWKSFWAGYRSLDKPKNVKWVKHNWED